MRGWLSAGRVAPEDMIWREGLESWQQAARFEYVLPDEEQDGAPNGAPPDEADEPEPEPFIPPEHKPKEPEHWPFDDMAE